MTDFADYQDPQAAAAAIGATSLVGTGLAIDPTAGGTIALDTSVGALHTPGKTVGFESAEQMLHANQGVTTEIAALIATGAAGGTPGGVPLLRGSTVLLNGSTAALAIGGSATLPGQAILSPSYDLKVTVTSSAAGTIQLGEIQLQWQESGIAVSQKTFQVVGSTGGHAVTITGPVRGSTLVIKFTNDATSASTMTFGYVLVATSRLAANDLCRTITNVGGGPPAGIGAWAGIFMDFGVLANADPATVAAGNQTRGLAMYNGPVQIQAKTTSATTDFELQVIPVATLGVNPFPNWCAVLDVWSDTHGLINQQFIMPDVQCIVSLFNHNAATQNLGFLLTAAEPNVN